MKTRKPVFQSFLIIFIALSFIPSINQYSQTAYNSYVDYIISRVNIDSVSMYARELTGDTTTLIDGNPTLIYSRYAYSPSNELASRYILQKFRGWGMSSMIQAYSSTGWNIIARKIGTCYPNQYYIICGHYDDHSFNMEDTIHGADDNASGICAVLEAARVLKPYSFDYTIIFIALDEEEIGLYGSNNYADTALMRRDSILGVINLDMIAWDSNNDNKMTVVTDTNSSGLADIMYSSCLVYQPHLNPIYAYGSGGSDHWAFQQRGYKACLFIEDFSNFNIYYHTIGDNYEHMNRPYMVSIIKAAIASLIVLEKDFIINIEHEGLASTFDTTSRIVNAVITSKNKIAEAPNQPRLYYKTHVTSFSFVNPYYSSQDTFKFMIPGFPAGTTVNYYIAAQDSASTIVASMPAGCRGTSPPGLQPPNRLYSYYVLDNFVLCSQSVPKDLPPRTIVYDSIYVGVEKLIYDIDVSVTINHTNDTDLYIMLTHTGFGQTNMSIHNGGSGNNYIGTVFDDEADTLITNGTPPFTGLYRPEVSLDKYDNSVSLGYWILKIFNMSDSITGQLIEWCVNISYYNPIGIVNNQVPVKFSLSQNYPNPFNASTKINYEIPKQGNVKLIIYDILGREVSVLADGGHSPGKYTAIWNAGNFASGIYFYRLIHSDFVESKKMVLVK